MDGADRQTTDALNTPLRLRFEAQNAASNHVFVRIYSGDAKNICGSLFLPMHAWVILTRVLSAASDAALTFEHVLHVVHCEKCGVELSRITCPLCAAQMCERCWGDHPHAYGLHIEGSTK